MNKQDKIKEVKKLVNIGKIIHVFGNYNGDGTLWCSEDSKYIHYRNYGQSAIKNNLKDLTWLINNIFRASRKDFKFEVVKSIYA